MSEEECRRCSECEGCSHHWIERCDENDPPAFTFVCKHCEVKGLDCPECDGLGYVYDEEEHEQLQCSLCSGEGVVPVGVSEFRLVIPFWIDTEVYTQRDREMFAAGAEFIQLYQSLIDDDGLHLATIMKENESRVRMMCGKLGRQCTISACEAEFDPDGTWSYLKVEAKS